MSHAHAEVVQLAGIARFPCVLCRYLKQWEAHRSLTGTNSAVIRWKKQEEREKQQEKMRKQRAQERKANERKKKEREKKAKTAAKKRKEAAEASSNTIRSPKRTRR